jgi:hypothetical protein
MGPPRRPAPERQESGVTLWTRVTTTPVMPSSLQKATSFSAASSGVSAQIASQAGDPTCV